MHVEYPAVGKDKTEARSIYSSLFNYAPNPLALARSHSYLKRQLEATKRFEVDIPQGLEELSAWIDSNTRLVGHQYKEYLETRRLGDPRRYFVNIDNLIV